MNTTAKINPFNVVTVALILAATAQIIAPVIYRVIY